MNLSKNYYISNFFDKVLYKFSYKGKQNPPSKDTIEEKGKTMINYNENEKNNLFA